jgi:catechol 2,3-dioxygenase-like lactoylglutathione lyase family enzyme
MPRLDHAAFETDDPDSTAAFYERIFGAHVVKAEEHPVMAYMGNTGFAFPIPTAAFSRRSPTPRETILADRD